MEEFCRQFNIVMPKCIRLRNPMILQKLQDYGCHDFQVTKLLTNCLMLLKVVIHWSIGCLSSLNGQWSPLLFHNIITLCSYVLRLLWYIFLSEQN